MQFPKKSPAGHFTPLRYPGGKGKIAGFVRSILNESRLSDAVYVEPYAGGAAVAMQLLLQGRVKRVLLNDVSANVYAFWHSVLHCTDDLCDLISETPVNLSTWDEQKKILKSGSADMLALGFAMFFLNRTNRSGILNAGVIGGRSQQGKWLIDARYNSQELVRRVRAIERHKARIGISQQDAVGFLLNGKDKWPSNTLVYLDPPYFVKGKDLYLHHYDADDHAKVRDAVMQLRDQRWIVSYDDVPEISELYRDARWLRYTLGYAAREHTRGSEIMFFGPGVAMPPASGSMRETERFDPSAAAETSDQVQEPVLGST